MTIKKSLFIDIYNCLMELQAKSGRIVEGRLLIGLRYKKAFDLSVAIKDMKPLAEAYQETINNIGKEMGLREVKFGDHSQYVFPEDFPIDKRNEYAQKQKEFRDTDLEYDKNLITFTDADIEGIELNLTGAAQQVFFNELYKPST